MAEERNHEKKLQQVGPEKITAIINVILGEVKILKGQLRLAVEWASPETRLSLGTGVAAEVLGWSAGSYIPAIPPIDGIIMESTILSAYVALKETLNDCDEEKKRIATFREETD
jgi:hypothetical protein